MTDPAASLDGASGRPPAASGAPAGDGTPGVLSERLRSASPFALYENRRWQTRWSGLASGITARSPEADFGLSTASPAAGFFESHAALAGQLGFSLGLLGRQVHGSRVVRLERAPRIAASPAAAAPGGAPGEEAGPAGGVARMLVVGEADGLITTGSDVLLTVTAADCVPVYLIDRDADVLGLLHAGWRGTAAGVLERGIATAVEAGATPRRLRVHLGPAICGECYEVGQEVTRALGLGAEAGDRVDLRAVLADRAERSGVPRERVSRSAWCTRCARDRFHSHRGSRDEAGRMAAYLGRRGPAR